MKITNHASSGHFIEQNCQVKQSKYGVLNEKSVVILEGSPNQRKDFKAGAGSDMFRNLGPAIVVIGLLFATLVASLAVAVATLALKPTLITLGVGMGITVVTAALNCK